MPANQFTLSATPDVGATYTAVAVATPTSATDSLVVRCPVSPRVGDAVRLGGNFVPLVAVDDKGGDRYVISWDTAFVVSGFTGPTGLYAVESAALVAERFTLSVSDGGARVGSVPGLSLSESHPAYYAKEGALDDVASYVTAAPRGGSAPAVSLSSMPAYVETDAAGADAAATNADFADGLTELEKVAEPAMVICPDSVTFADPLLQADLVGKVVAHCEEQRRFAIVDAPDLHVDTELLTWRNTNLSSTYAGLFAPHLRIVTIDPDAIDRFTTVPPSGFVAGVMARTDRERGVHKAPGNERVTGIVGLSETFTQRHQDLLNPASVNLIRAFPGRGTRVWGARNATDDGTWRYVNVRRLFNMIETSVDRSTQWVVFEPNTATTWIRIKVSVENFLNQQWRAGALAGTKPEEAYRVRVGLGETMTEADIDAGLVITEVAIAPAKPAEFVVFRFSHKRLSE